MATRYDQEREPSCARLPVPAGQTSGVESNTEPAHETYAERLQIEPQVLPADLGPSSRICGANRSSIPSSTG